MTLRSIVTIAALLGAAATIALPARAANDKQLQNMKGTVSFQAPSAAAQPVAPNATVVLGDSDYAITGSDSLAGIGLPDSSRVLVGASSKVQLGFFNQVQGTNAKFVVYNGKVRFIVQHPAGAKANYQFQTPTGEVAVRGTEGDIESDGSNLQVNVYEVCDANTPVTVTTKDGQSFKVLAGQSFAAQIVNGIVRTEVQNLTQQMINQFSPDFGVPTSWDAAKGEIVGMATNQATNAVSNATGGIVGSNVVSGAIGGLFGHKSAPSPSPSAAPKSDTCTHQ
jgi:ferric-dicitrate binding protein FerR (iron transport regulator)